MLCALAVNAILVTSLLAFAIWSSIAWDAWPFWVFVALFALLGSTAPARRGRRRRRTRAPADADLDRVAEITRRLCVVADMKAPEVWVERDAAPLSWTVSTPWTTSRVSVTTGLLDQLDDREVAAVIAHELSHIANRDAVVMTVLAAPSIWIFRGMRELFRNDRSRGLLAIVFYGPLAAIPATVLVLTSRIVSRHRELAADRGAAALTGSPARLSAALRRMSGELARLPAQDLRVAATRDPLNIVPARAGRRRGIRRLWATHPPLEQRLDQLDRIERAMHG